MTVSPYATVSQIGAALIAGTVTSQAACQQYLDRIAASALRAVVVTRPQAAVLADAAASDARRTAGHPIGPLDGVPFTLKVVHQTNGVLTSNGTPAVNWTPTSDGDIAGKL